MKDGYARACDTNSKRFTAQGALPELNKSRRAPGRSEIPDGKQKSMARDHPTQQACGDEAEKCQLSRTRPIPAQGGLQPDQ